MSDFDDKFEAAYAKWKAANPGATGMFATKPSSQVNTPQDVGKAVLGAVKRNAIPLGALGGVGALMDLAFPEEGLGMMAARSGVQGLTNVLVNKTVPEALGGNKNMSVLGGFAGAALPEFATLGGGRIASNILERNLNRRVEGATANALGKLDKNAMVAEDTLMAPSPSVPKVMPDEGPELTNATFAAQAPLNATIDAARAKYGAPIGDAYRSLKGEAPIDATGFGKRADDMERDLIAPASGRAHALVDRFRMLDPKAQKEAFDRAHPELGNLGANPTTVSPHMELPDGTIIVPGSPAEALAKRRNENLAKLGMGPSTTFKDIDIKEKPEFKAKPARLDAMRELRQETNTALRTAQGGDKFLLGRLQDQLDTELMEHLPPEMNEMRKQYAGFMGRWGYDQQHALAKMDDPQKVADWLFKDPVKARNLMKEAQGEAPLATGRSSETKITINGRTRTVRSGDAAAAAATNPRVEALRQQFLQHVYGSLNPTDPIAKQVSEVQARLKPYMKDEKSAASVLGPNAGMQMREMVQWPKFTEDFKRSMEKNPEFKAKFIAGVKQSILERHMDPDSAAVEMIRQLGGPEASPSNLVDMMKTLPAPAAKTGNNSWRNMAIGRHLAMAGMYGGAALGGAHMGMGMAYQIGALGTFLAADRMASFSAASKLGITAPLLRAMSTKNGYIAGRAMSRALLNAGMRNLQSGTNEPVELY